MIILGNFLKCLLLVTILHQLCVKSVSGLCELSFVGSNKRYNYSLSSPTKRFPHGVLSEDGFYKVAVNETVLWFQLCDGMIFNHDLPRCIDCSDCGGPSRCGMDCSALVANNIGGYSVCTTIGRISSISIDIIDTNSPDMGVVVHMSNGGPKLNCSLSVSVLCDSNGVQEPHSLEKLGTCAYTTVLRHPLGCANIISVHRAGWGWLGTFIIILLCLFGAYLLAGAVYRSFVLGIRGVNVIPNLDLWRSLPHRTQIFFASLVRTFSSYGRPSSGHRSSYSPVNF